MELIKTYAIILLWQYILMFFYMLPDKNNVLRIKLPPKRQVYMLYSDLALE